MQAVAGAGGDRGHRHRVMAGRQKTTRPRRCQRTGLQSPAAEPAHHVRAGLRQRFVHIGCEQALAACQDRQPGSPRVLRLDSQQPAGDPATVFSAGPDNCCARSRCAATEAPDPVRAGPDLGARQKSDPRSRHQ